ncbi:bifunctional methylenetetrahydrofolate dehydrogenase/methenyltetrahydrofolate cyclohydrolase FolD [bacterium]|nr:bifunctional methylenetetrahydrofolate dehydrogenase/methenyltetrahydrofolate cyclohydrolase FolD [bacterium]
MYMQILDGKALGKEIQEEVKLEVEKLSKKPHLAVILAGENPASKIYVNTKNKTCERLGIKSTVINLPENVTEFELKSKIRELNVDDEINAILVQLPLPAHINESECIKEISPIKDVDGFTPENLGALVSGKTPFAYPCTPSGIITLLKRNNIQISGKHAVVIGRSNIVGKPLSLMLLKENATVTMCHSKTKNLSEITKTADILISATGKRIVTKDMVKNSAVVVDVGIIRNSEGKLEGDVDFEQVKDTASYITPVPGGVGPMTIASLMKNTLELFLKQNK